MNLTRPQLKLFKTPQGLLKVINVVLVIIAIAAFSSAYSGWVIYVGFVIASGLVYGISVCIIYLFGDGQFQMTFYEPMMDCFFSPMFFIAAIICWANSNKYYYHYYSGALITTGVFCLVSSVLFGVNGYFTLINSGTLEKLRGTPATANSPQHIPDQQLPATIQTHDSNEAPPAYTSPSTSEHPPVYPMQTTVFPSTITNITISN